MSCQALAQGLGPHQLLQCSLHRGCRWRPPAPDCNATARTASSLHALLQTASCGCGCLAGVPAGAVQNHIFTRTLHRQHCAPDPNWRSREGGEQWSTIKPLAVQGFDMRRTLLLDNEACKAADGEAGVCIHPPRLRNNTFTPTAACRATARMRRL